MAGILRRRLRRLLHRQEMTLESSAERVWQIAPGSMSISLPAYCLPNQLERVTNTAYSYYWADGGDREDLQRQMAGGIERFQAPTRGFLLKDAYLFDGAIHKANFGTRLYPRAGRLPQFHIEHEIDRGAVHSTFDGNMFFGLWLTDDCTIYPLAASEGLPVTTDQPASAHTLAYEDWLGMKPVRLHSAFLRKSYFSTITCRIKTSARVFDQLAIGSFLGSRSPPIPVCLSSAAARGSAEFYTMKGKSQSTCVKDAVFVLSISMWRMCQRSWPRVPVPKWWPESREAI